MLNKEAEIKEEEAKLQAIVAQWQKEADDKIISNAKYLAVVYPNAYKKLINFPIQTMNLVQAKKTLEYENQIKQYERALKEKESMPLRVRQAVSSWHTIKGIPYYFFYYYYPTKVLDVSLTSEKARRMIWNFKKGELGYEIIEILQEKLLSTFKENDLKEMTLVCIPASTIYTNNIRYKSFSENLCNSLGMKNGFQHIQITKEKLESHLGETSKAEYKFDTHFFKGAYVILFDDVVTTGYSMEEFKTYLMQLGAEIICCISIGRTYNESYVRVHPYTETY